MKLFEVIFTVKTGGLEFKELMAVIAKDKKSAKDTFLDLIAGSKGLKGGTPDRPVLYDLRNAKVLVQDVREPRAQAPNSDKRRK